MFLAVMNGIINLMEKYKVIEENHPALSVDVLIFTIRQDQLNILLIRRGKKPYENAWALPGGFIKINESLEEAALRKLMEETNLKNVYLEQLYTFGDPERDPRERVITVAYFALIPSEPIRFISSKSIKDALWYSVNNLPKLAFDHQKIIQYALGRIRSKIEYSNIVYSLLPKKFTLSKLQKIYEIILGKKLDKRNFRKRILSLGLLKSTGQKEGVGAHRPAMLYQFATQQIVFFE